MLHHQRFTIRQELLIGPLLGLLEDASRLALGTRRDEELYGTDRVGAFAAFTSNIDGDALGFESAFGDLCLDPRQRREDRYELVPHGLIMSRMGIAMDPRTDRDPHPGLA